MLLGFEGSMQAIEDMYQDGEVIQGRYLVEDILGTGGFSVVYLVSDQLFEQEGEHSGTTHRYALKMLTDHDKQERSRFLFEAELLTRLHHPALPRIQRVFEDKAAHQACILMDYVDGTNLDILRKRRPEKSFSLAEALVILAPIVEALTYLHTQPSPIIHRDIKPANLIVPKDGKGTVLVDFGIAKEYEVEATTTAIRHCSPGYAAPEQYSSIGTDLRTDIYGLAATLYVLLSNTVPVDALRRATKLASREPDPLIPIRKLVPNLPISVANVIQRALSIDMKRRFANANEFWQALQDAAQQDYQVEDEQDQNDLAMYGAQSASTTNKRFWGIFQRPRTLWVPLLLAALVLLIIGNLTFGLGTYFRGNHNSTSPSAASTPKGQTTTTMPTTTHKIPTNYPVVAHSYNGTVRDLLTNQTASVALTQVEQTNNQIYGTFNGMQKQSNFTGVLDTSKHIFFTVAGQPALFFDGAIRSDSFLVGNYCTIDSAGQCVGHYGVWSLAPTH